MIPGDVTKRFNIPIEHLDFKYVESCKDVREVVKILKVLRSGDEGSYPELERFTERRVEQLDPNNRILRKSAPIKTKYDLEPDEWKAISGDLSQWLEEMKVADMNGNEDEEDDDDEDLVVVRKKDILEMEEENKPPVRGSKVTIKGKKATVVEPKSELPTTPPVKVEATSHQQAKKKKKRVKPREYREWDKINVEEELKKIDDEDDQKKEQSKQPEKQMPQGHEGKTVRVQTGGSKVPALAEINKAVLSESELAAKAEREKEKGNEAFRAGDFEEALVYYNRSLQLQVSMAVLNNRAFTHLKLEKWDLAIKDCNLVLAEDPKNVKALFRRATAYKSRKQFAAAKKDLEKVVSVDSTYTKAADMLESVEKAIVSSKKEGNRLVVEDVSEEEEEEQVGKEEKAASEREMQKPHAVKVQIPKKVTKEQEKPAVAQHESKSKDIWAAESVPVHVEPVPVQKPEPAIKKVAEAKPEPKVVKAAAPPRKAKKAEKIYQVKPIPAGELLDELTKRKDEAGKLFASSKYGEALEVYLKAIDTAKSKSFLLHDDKNSCVGSSEFQSAQSSNIRYTFGLLLTNAAACQLKTGDLEECIDNCTESLKYVPRFVKTFLRRATALQHLSRFKEAIDDYEEILSIEPSSKAAKEGKQKCQVELDKQPEPKEDLGTAIAIEENEDDEEDEEEEVSAPVPAPAAAEDEEDVDSKSKPICEEKSRNKTMEKPTVKTHQLLSVPQLASNAGVFEYGQAWSSIVKSCSKFVEKKSTDDEDGGEEEIEADPDMFEKCWSFVDSIPQNLTAKVLAHNLEGSSIALLVGCLDFAMENGTDDGKVEKCAQVLTTLASLNRFDVTLMFMDIGEKGQLKEIIDKISKSSKLSDLAKKNLRNSFDKRLK